MNGHALQDRIIFAILTIAALSGCAPEPVQTARFDEQAVRDTVLELENAMNLAVDGLRCDLAALGEREPIFVSDSHVVRTGAELQEMCTQMVAQRTGAVFAADVITANALSNDVAYVVREGNYTINFTDGTSTALYLVMTTIWHNVDNAWKMVHLHESFRDL